MTKKMTPRNCGSGPQIRLRRQIEHCNGKSESVSTVESKSDCNVKSETDRIFLSESWNAKLKVVPEML